MSTMIYCKVNVIMTSFAASDVAGVPSDVTATMELTDQTPNPNGKAYFTLTAEDSLIVSVPAGTPVRIQYSLKTDLEGVYYMFGAFFSDKPTAEVKGAFPMVMLAEGVSIIATMQGYDISPDNYTMNVVDQNSTVGLYAYTIGIQDVATGAIGLYDPDIENDPSE